MPNWCNNRLTITGEAEAVASLLASTKPVPYSPSELKFFASHHPIPPRLLDFSSDKNECKRRLLRLAYGADNVVEWTSGSRGWGTKWGDHNTRLVSHVDGEAVLQFDSAWNPPIDGILNVSLQHHRFTGDGRLTTTGRFTTEYQLRRPH